MIRAWIGLLGSGKTFSMILELRREFARRWKEGDPPSIFTNMAGLKAPEGQYFIPVDDLPLVRNGIMCIDEAGVCFSSRFWQGTSKANVAAFAMGRKNGLDLYYTCHDPERVDKLLRDITAEWVFCRRIGNTIVQLTMDTTLKHIIRRRVVQLKESDWGLYDSYETIDERGASSGQGAATVKDTRTTAQRNAQREQRGLRGPSKKKKEVPIVSVPDIWNMNLDLVPEAIAARDYLSQNAVLHVGPSESGWLHTDPDVWKIRSRSDHPLSDWGQRVRDEMDRQAWLRQWGLRPQDAPLKCTRSNPWMKGEDPLSVEIRTRERLAQLAREEMISQALLAAEKKEILAGLTGPGGRNGNRN